MSDSSYSLPLSGPSTMATGEEEPPPSTMATGEEGGFLSSDAEPLPGAIVAAEDEPALSRTPFGAF